MTKYSILREQRKPYYIIPIYVVGTAVVVVDIQLFLFFYFNGILHKRDYTRDKRQKPKK